MILADVVKLSATPSRRVPSSLKGEHNSLLETKNRVFGSLSQTNDLFGAIENRNRVGLEKNRFLRQRIDFFGKMGTLPLDLEIDKNDPLSLAAKSPRIELSELRQVAEKLDFVLLPFEYMRPAAYTSESASTQKSIQNFNTEMSRLGQVYTLCPINCYDVFKHVQAERDLPIYGNSKNHLLQAFSTLMPLHRVTFTMITALQQKFAQVAERTEVIEENFAQQMDSISREFSRRIDEVASQNRLKLAEKIQQQENRKKGVSKQALATINELTSQIQNLATAFEPLMFMIPTGVSVSSGEGSCIVGPCWGPDFDDIVFTILGFSKVAGQREHLIKESQKWNF